MIKKPQRYTYLNRMPESWGLGDLRAVQSTRPVPIEEFEVLKDCPLDPVPELAQLAMDQQGEPFMKWWQYFYAYDRELARLAEDSRNGKRERPLRLLEIGVWRGGSLSLWREYFGPDAIIFGVDIDPESAKSTSKGVEIRIGSQVDAGFMEAVVAEMGGVDVIIDDGSHECEHVIESLRMLWPKLADGGTYIIEDLHTSYWPAWGGGLRRKESSIEALKRLIDVMHQPYFEAQADPDGLGITHDSLGAVTFYDSVASLQKKRMPKPQPFHGGSPSWWAKSDG